MCRFETIGNASFYPSYSFKDIYPMADNLVFARIEIFGSKISMNIWTTDRSLNVAIHTSDVNSVKCDCWET